MPQKKKGGWFGDSRRHALAARGIKTGRKEGSLEPSLHGMAMRHRRMGSLRDEALLLTRQMKKAGVEPTTEIHLKAVISLLEERNYNDALQNARFALKRLQESKKVFPKEVRYEVQERTMRTRIIPAIREAQELKEV